MTDLRTDQNERHDADRPLGEIVLSLGHDVSELVQAQVDLAKVEMRETARDAGKAGAMGGAAAVLAIPALVLLGMAAAWGIAEALALWFALLIVGVAYGVVALILVVVARQRLDAVTDGPVHTMETLQEDARWLQQHRN